MRYQVNISKIFPVLLFLFAVSINSCEHECEICRNYNPKTGQLIDEITACDRGMIRDLESKGYNCK